MKLALHQAKLSYLHKHFTFGDYSQQAQSFLPKQTEVSFF